MAECVQISNLGSSKLERKYTYDEPKTVIKKEKKDIKKVEDIAFDVDKLKEEYPNVKDIEIESAFEEGKFNIFKRYCEDNKKINLYDLNNEDILNLPKQRGIGVVRFKQIIERLNEIKDNISNVKVEQTPETVEQKVIKAKKVKEIKEIKDVKNINEIISIALGNLNDQESLTIIARIIEGLSIEDTGEILESTEEEAKEIEAKALNKIKNTFEQYNAIESIKKMFNSAKEFKIKDLEKKINEESEFIINFIKKDKLKGLTRSGDSDTLVFS